jgi:formylglycine-generating enzyme
MKNFFFSICLLLAAFATLSSQTPKHKSMVRIPGATFPMGTEASKVSQIAAAFNIAKHPDLIQAETPQHTVTINSFYLDKYEVTNSQFGEFVRANPQWSRRVRTPTSRGSDRIGNYLKDWDGDNFPKGKARHPVANVSWYAAAAFCQSVGKRLPTEAEWEFAARGGLRDKTFPWGNEPVDKTRANYAGSEINGTTPVGSYTPNGYGLFDMAGNVWEFMADEWGPYSDLPQTNPVAGAKLFLDKSFYDVITRRVIRGGSFGGAPLNLRVTYRDSHPPDGARDFVGFRCAAS